MRVACRWLATPKYMARNKLDGGFGVAWNRPRTRQFAGNAPCRSYNRLQRIGSRQANHGSTSAVTNAPQALPKKRRLEAGAHGDSRAQDGPVEPLVGVAGEVIGNRPPAASQGVGCQRHPGREIG